MNLASPAEPHALAHLMREQRLMDFDIGEIELSNGERFGFSMIAGAGYDAAIMEGAEPSKRLLGPMAYFTAAFANFAPQFSRITLTIDVFRCRECTVVADPPLAVQYDGEVTGTMTPFTVRMLPEAARFVVSEECLALYGEESATPLDLD